MRKVVGWCAVALMVTAVAPQSRADILSSETECLQRQIELKRAEDILNRTAAEMAALSLQRFPELKLGGPIGQNREQLAASVSETRKLLKSLCDRFYP